MADPLALDVTQPETIPNMSTAMIIDELRRIKHLLAEQSERKEVPSPGLIRLPYQGHTRIRMVAWHLHPILAGTYALLVGSERKSTIGVTATQTGGCIPEALPLILDGGLNILVIDTVTGVQATAAQIVDAFVLGYTE